ncbi:MAG: ATP--guanido phosphotransferase [Phycisphaerales bacterium]|nr:ATP--guanido phosphotransferase [Phycisphaerales bacterium]
MTIPFSAALSQIGPDSDVVVTSRVRIARNISGFPFICRASNAVRLEIMRVVKRAVDRPALSSPSDRGLQWIDLQAVPSRERVLLAERHLVSRHFANSEGPRALALSHDEHASVMVNEEDHLRIQYLCAGSRLPDAFAAAFALECGLAETTQFAFHSRWGYLTACPTNVGSGIRLSAMLHLPAVQIMGEVERIKRAARELHLAVRGYYGEGSESAGDFFQFSNQQTLGSSEDALLADFHGNVLPRLISYERDARAAALERHRNRLEDLVFRARANLSAARLLTAATATRDLSRMRLGAVLGMLPINLARLQRLLLQVQPAHLSMVDPRAADGEEVEREVRATFVRQELAQSSTDQE